MKKERFQRISFFIDIANEWSFFLLLSRNQQLLLESMKNLNEPFLFRFVGTWFSLLDFVHERRSKNEKKKLCLSKTNRVRWQWNRRKFYWHIEWMGLWIYIYIALTVWRGIVTNEKCFLFTMLKILEKKNDEKVSFHTNQHKFWFDEKPKIHSETRVQTFQGFEIEL